MTSPNRRDGTGLTRFKDGQTPVDRIQILGAIEALLSKVATLPKELRVQVYLSLIQQETASVFDPNDLPCQRNNSGADGLLQRRTMLNPSSLFIDVPLNHKRLANVSRFPDHQLSCFRPWRSIHVQDQLVYSRNLTFRSEKNRVTKHESMLWGWLLDLFEGHQARQDSNHSSVLNLYNDFQTWLWSILILDLGPDDWLLMRAIRLHPVQTWELLENLYMHPTLPFFPLVTNLALCIQLAIEDEPTQALPPLAPSQLYSVLRPRENVTHSPPSITTDYRASITNLQSHFPNLNSIKLNISMAQSMLDILLSFEEGSGFLIAIRSLNLPQHSNFQVRLNLVRTNGREEERVKAEKVLKRLLSPEAAFDKKREVEKDVNIMAVLGELEDLGLEGYEGEVEAGWMTMEFEEKIWGTGVKIKHRIHELGTFLWVQ